MSRAHWLALLIILTALLLTMEVANAADLQISWDRVERDINGDIITADIEYRIYSLIQDVDDDFKLRAQTPDTITVAPLVYPACFSVYVTAIRMDTKQESAPSNIAFDCFYADGQPEPEPEPEPDPEPVLVPQPPQPTALEMRIDG